MPTNHLSDYDLVYCIGLPRGTAFPDSQMSSLPVSVISGLL